MAGQSYIYAGVAGYRPPVREGQRRRLPPRRRRGSGGTSAHLETHTVFVHPTDPNVVLAGAVDGVWRSSDRGATFQRANFPDQGKQIGRSWSIQDPSASIGRLPVDASQRELASWRRLPIGHQAIAPPPLRRARHAHGAAPKRPDEIYVLE
jgi:hypothetical protein